MRHANHYLTIRRDAIYLADSSAQRAEIFHLPSVHYPAKGIPSPVGAGGSANHNSTICGYVSAPASSYQVQYRSEAAMHTPNELRYTRTDEWVRIEGEIATIGITDYAQSELGDIVFLELPEPGRYLQVDESFGVIESVKAASDLYAPLEGEVIEVNTALQSALETINQDPYGKADD
jgi:glycine cleavage system H protein